MTAILSSDDPGSMPRIMSRREAERRAFQRRLVRELETHPGGLLRARCPGDAGRGASEGPAAAGLSSLPTPQGRPPRELQMSKGKQGLTRPKVSPRDRQRAQAGQARSGKRQEPERELWWARPRRPGDRA